MKLFKKVLVFALAVVLAANGLSVNVKAADCTDYTKAYEKCADKDMQAEIDAIMDKIAKECGDVDCVDPEKGTMITFEGSPVKVVKYDGNKHGLSADVRQVVSGKYIAEPVIWYVGITAEKEIYHSLVAPTEVGYYNVVVAYPGNCEWYPCVAYGVVVILPVCDKPECPDRPNCPGCPDKPECPDKPDCPGGEEPEDPVVPEDPVDPEPVVPEDPVDPEPVVPEDPVDPEPELPEDDVIDEPIEEDDVIDEPIEEDDEEEPVIEVVVEDEDAAPKTGDTANVMLYGVALAAALVAIVVVLRRRNA